MGEAILTRPKFSTELTEYSISLRGDKTGPNADNLEVDAIIIGAGFAGIFMLTTLRDRGYTAVIYEAGDDIGVSSFRPPRNCCLANQCVGYLAVELLPR